jgi:hypothetical protein
MLTWRSRGVSGSIPTRASRPDVCLDISKDGLVVPGCSKQLIRGFCVKNRACCKLLRPASLLGHSQRRAAVTTREAASASASQHTKFS